jgi:hypothetical protein
MSDHETRDRPTAETAGATTDSEIYYGLLLKLGFGLMGLVLVSATIVYFLYVGFLDWERSREPEPPVLEETRAPILVPGAKLLPRPEAYRRDIESQEAQDLESYGWVDEAQGIAHIPIERAMEIVARDGLPSMAAPAAASGEGVEAAEAAATAGDAAGEAPSAPREGAEDGGT